MTSRRENRMRHAVASVVTKIRNNRFLRKKPRFGNNNTNSQEEDPPLVQVTDAECGRRGGGEQHDASSSSSMPFGYHCCKRWAWPAVTFRCSTHPHEFHVSFRDEKGDTALHWTCLGKPPVDAVLALLTACPDLASATNNEGQLPFHVACSYRASTEVIRALLCFSPEGAGQCNGFGSYPMHILCDYGCGVDSMRAVLETDGGVQSLTKVDGIFGRRPLFILNARAAYHSELHRLRRERPRLALDDATELDRTRLRQLVRSCAAVEFWQKASLLILAESKGSALLPTEGVDHGRIVHACTAIHACPATILDYALLLYPEQLMIPDENGQLPLHIAASRSDSANVNDILDACPDASKVRDHNGRLAVELAVASGCSWRGGVGELLVTNPTSLETLNVDERLYPWIWASLGRKPHGGASALFESIRARPGILG